MYHYFKWNSPLPSPTGPFSKEIQAIAISSMLLSPSQQNSWHENANINNNKIS